MEPDDAVDTAWAELDKAWDDPEAHRRFIGLCAALGRLPDAATRYRQVRDDSPERSEIAKTRLGAIATAATAALYETRSALPKKRSRVTLVGLGVAVGMVLWALWAWLHAR